MSVRDRRFVVRVFVHSLERRQLLASSYAAELSNPGVQPRNLVTSPQASYFTATTPATGRELWTTDGTAAGTRLVADVVAGPGDASISHLTIAGRFAYFVATNKDGDSLYRSDGTANGTLRLLKLESGKRLNGLADGGRNGAYFQLRSADKKTYGFWRTDGTAKGTTRLVEKGLPLFTDFAAAPDLQTYIGSGGGDDLLISDGTAAGTRRLSFKADRIAQLSGAKDHLYFATLRGDNDVELFKLDRPGDKATSILKADALSSAATPYGSSLWGFFSARDSAGMSIFRVTDTTLSRYTQPDGSLFAQDEIVGGGAGWNDIHFALNLGRGAKVYDPIDAKRVVVEVAVPSLGNVDDIVQVPGYPDQLLILTNDEYQRVVERIDRKTGQRTTLATGVLFTRAYSEPEDDGFQLVGEKVVFRSFEFGGSDELYAYDGKSGQLTRLTSGYAPGMEVRILASVNTPKGVIVVSRSSLRGESGPVAVDLVDAQGVARGLYTRAYDDTVDPTARIDVGTSKNGPIAYVSLTYFQQRGDVDLIDLTTGNVRNIMNHSTQPGLVLGVAGSVAFIQHPGNSFETDTLWAYDVDRRKLSSVDTDGAVLGEAIATPDPTKPRLDMVSGLRVYAIETGGVRPLFDLPVYLSGGVSMLAAGGSSYAIIKSSLQQNSLIRIRGSSVETVAMPEASQAGAHKLIGLLTSADGKWVYVMAVKANTINGRWHITRFLATDPSRREIVLDVQPSSSESVWPPKLVGIDGQDVVFVTDDQHPSVVERRLYAARAGQPLRTIALPGDEVRLEGNGFAAGDNVFVRLNDGRTMRYHDGGVIEVRGLRGADKVKVQNGLAFWQAGSTLRAYRYDTRITGEVINDLNGNGSRDAGEHGFAGWRIFLDLNGNGRFDRKEPTVFTDEEGRFTFYDLSAGTYKLRFNLSSDYVATNGTVVTVRLKDGESYRRRFGVRKIV